MGLRKIMRFACDEIAMNKKQFLLVLVLMVAGMMLTGAAIYLYECNEYNERICDETLTRGVSGTFCIDISNVCDQLTEKKMLDEWQDIEGMEYIGGYENDDSYTIDGMQEIAVLQENSPYKINKIIPGEFEDEIKYMFMGFSMNYGASKLMNLSLSDGGSIEAPPEHTEYIYLGKELRDIPIGREYKVSSGYLHENGEVERFEITYIVKGYLDSNQRLMDSNVYNTERELDTYYYDLDYMMLLVGDDYVSGNICYFTIEEGADYNEVLKSINDVANKYDELISIGSLEGAFATRAENDAKEAYMYMQLAAIIMVSVVFIQICAQSSNIIKNARKYGIMYANGITKGDLRGIVCAESVIKLIAAMFMTVAAFAVFIWYMDMGRVYNYNLLLSVRKFVIGKLALITFGVSVIGTIVPLLVLENMKPVDLIKANK